MESWIKVGAKCVLVDDNFTNRSEEYYEEFPIKGKVYTIRNVIIDDEGVAIRLKEIINDEFEYVVCGTLMLSECSFYARRFRPLIKKTMTQDITMFKKFITKKVLDELV